MLAQDERTVARDPAGGSGEGVAESHGLCGSHRRGNRDLGHGLHATCDDHVVDTGHNGLRGKVHGLL